MIEEDGESAQEHSIYVGYFYCILENMTGFKSQLQPVADDEVE